MITSSGAAVTARNVGYNGSVGAGASTTFGFLGSWTGTNSVPTLSCTAT
jgi:mannan endo-1,4-beta-mannosidase